MVFLEPDEREQLEFTERHFVLRGRRVERKVAENRKVKVLPSCQGCEINQTRRYVRVW